MTGGHSLTKPVKKSGSGLHGELPPADTLLKLLSVCDEFLADEAWLLARPPSWRDDLQGLTERLETRLREHALLHISNG